GESPGTPGRAGFPAGPGAHGRDGAQAHTPDRPAAPPAGGGARGRRRLRAVAGGLAARRLRVARAGGRGRGRPAVRPFRRPRATRRVGLPVHVTSRLDPGRALPGGEPGDLPVALLRARAALRLPRDGLLHPHGPVPELPGRAGSLPPPGTGGSGSGARWL
ncbi:MAG: hypothetical protein AVDCRST_MAG25-2842, partial [uncultured Rubrobacteraceae bacterium]